MGFRGSSRVLVPNMGGWAASIAPFFAQSQPSRIIACPSPLLLREGRRGTQEPSVRSMMLPPSAPPLLRLQFRQQGSIVAVGMRGPFGHSFSFIFLWARSFRRRTICALASAATNTCISRGAHAPHQLMCASHFAAPAAPPLGSRILLNERAAPKFLCGYSISLYVLHTSIVSNNCWSARK